MQYVFIFVLDPKKRQNSNFKAIHVVLDLAGEYPCYVFNVFICNN